MKIIGLTGGIGSGKSTVARLLAEQGAVIIDADKVGHAALSPGSKVWQQVATAFGRRIVTQGGDIDRRRLGEIVFASPEARLLLNRIMHPVIHEMIKAQMREYLRQGVEVVILEAPLLIEAGWSSSVDEVWVTIASEETVLKRLQGRSGFTEKQSEARIHSQLSSEDRIKNADIVIDTDCSIDELKAKVVKLRAGLHG